MEVERMIDRGPYSFRVLDTEETRSWDFWRLWAEGNWEASTFEALDEVLKPGDMLFDVGAWLGPIALWEAARGVHVVAFEPDPAAFNFLKWNIRLNRLENMITPLEIAIIDGRRRIPLFYSQLGDSKSRIFNQVFPNRLEVAGDTLEEMFAIIGRPKAIKFDVEGGESLILPHSGRFLRQQGVALVLSLHPFWYAEGTAEAVDAELAHWEMRDLDNHENFLCTPKDLA